MGRVPVMPETPERRLLRLERELAHRRSRLRWRRRRAHRACVELIVLREKALRIHDAPQGHAERRLVERVDCVCVDGPCDGCVEHTRMGDRTRRFMRVRPRELPPPGPERQIRLG